MRDLMLLGAMLLLVPMSLRNGFVAYLLWGWAGLAAVHSYMYGFMIGVPVAQLFAIIALVLFVVLKDAERQKFAPDPTTTLFLVFALHAILCAAMAYPGHPRNWELATNLIKTILFCVLMPMVVTSRYRIHVLVLMIAVATSYHGMVDGLKFLASGGGHLARGIKKFGDNNHFAMVLIMVLPLMLYSFRYSANRWMRYGFLVAIPILVLSVIATQSRGGLATLSAIALWFILTSRRKLAGLFGVGLCVAMVIMLAPAHWTERMNTMGAADEDVSFLGRVGAWRVSAAIATAHPLVGGGLHAVELGAVWEKFRNAPSFMSFLTLGDLVGNAGAGRAAHSIYFEVLGDMGFIGLLIFLAIAVNSLVTAKQITHMAKEAGPQFEWARSLAEMLAISVIAFLLGGALLSAAYFELPYIIFMLLEVLKQVVSHSINFKRPPILK